MLLLLAGGVAADRWSRSAVMAASNVVAFLAQAAIAVVLFAGWYSTWVVAVLAGVNGAAAAFYRPSADAIVPQLVDAADLGRANSVVRVSLHVSRLAGPALGGLLVAVIGARYLIAWGALTFLAAAFLLARVRVPATPARRQRLLTALRDGWTAFTGRRWLWTCTVQMTAGGMAWVAGFALMGPVIADRYYDGSRFWGLVVSAYGVGLLVGGLLMMVWKPRRLLVAANLCSLALPLPLIASAAQWPPPAVLGCTVLAGLGTEVAMVTWITAKQRYVPVGELGRVSAYDQAGGVAFAPLAYPLAGLVAAEIGPRPVAYASAAVLTLTPVLILLVSDVRGLGAHDGAGTAVPDAAAGPRP